MNSKLNASAGSCTLVGAGPGDPELLTIKAVKAIARATLILVDDLVNPDILNHANAQCRVVHVGKRGGCVSTPQSFIAKLMIQSVLAGEHVVRLKGGDPFIFGRGGEEVEQLWLSGITTTVINGITSGLAAMTELGCPLTHRQHAQGVIFVTGHQQTGSAATDWFQLGQLAHQARLTLVIYMGAGSVEKIQHGLAQTMPHDTPVALIQHATTKQQKIKHTTLIRMIHDLKADPMGSPCIISVGNVLSSAIDRNQQQDPQAGRDELPQQNGILLNQRRRL
jgi:uroporphyrin-III C-methyltransferase